MTPDRAARDVRPRRRRARPDRRLRRAPLRADPAAVPLVHGRPALLQPLRRRRRHRRVGPSSYDRRLCLDVSHSKLAATFLGQVRSPRPSTCWPRTPTTCTSSTPPVSTARASRSATARSTGRCSPSSSTRSPGRRLHPRDLAGPRQRRRGLLDRARAAGAVVLSPTSSRDAHAPCGSCRSAPSAGVGPPRRSTSPSVGIPGWRAGRSSARPATCPASSARGGAAVVDGALRAASTACARRCGACAHASERCARPCVHAHLSYADIVAAVATPRRGVRAGHHRARHRRRRPRLPRLVATGPRRWPPCTGSASAASTPSIAVVRRDRAARCADKWHPSPRPGPGRSPTASTRPGTEPPADPGLRVLSLARLAPEKRLDRPAARLRPAAPATTPTPG